MAPKSRRWDPARRAEAYRELEHPADLLLEIWGRDLAELFQNALFAFYDQSAELAGFRSRRRVSIAAWGDGLDIALRNLLAEALYRFATEGFVAVSAEVAVSGGAVSGGGEWGTVPDGEAQTVQVAAVLRGERADPARHVLSAEIKAVTFHRLSVEWLEPGAETEAVSLAADALGWRATVLFDI